MPRSIIAFALFAALAGPAAAQDKKPAPGPAPGFVVIDTVDKPAAEIHCSRTVAMLVPYQVVYKVERNGQTVEVVKTAYKETLRTENMRFPLKDCSVQTAGGKKLGTQDALKRLRVGSAIVLSQSTNGKPVDPVYLRALNPETVVLMMTAPVRIAPPPGPKD